MLLKVYKCNCATRAIVFSNEDRSSVASGRSLDGFSPMNPFVHFRGKTTKAQKEKTKTEIQMRGIITIHLLQFRRAGNNCGLSPWKSKGHAPFRPTPSPAPTSFVFPSGWCPRFNPWMPFLSRKEVFRSERASGGREFSSPARFALRRIFYSKVAFVQVSIKYDTF